MKKTPLIIIALLTVLLVFVGCEQEKPKEFDPKSIPFTIEFYKYGGYVEFKNAPSSLRYSIDGKALKELKGTVVELGDYQKITIYAARPMSSEDNLFSINCTGSKCYVYGNIMSLVLGESFVNSTVVHENAFRGIFKGNENIETHPMYELYLPATTLAKNCYYEAFSGCTSLTKAPELPATVMVEGCYEKMFEGCKSLESAPDLTATVLAPKCYKSMFEGCESLVSAPRILAEKMNTESCASMFASCTSLKEAPELHSTELAEGCYYSMFLGCENLEKAPELKATTMKKGCYQLMFRGCSELKTGPALPAMTLAESCYEYMFLECTGLTQAPELPATETEEACYRGMFCGCKALTEGPVLPAPSLAPSCYKEMFYNCSNLNKITCLGHVDRENSSTSSFMYFVGGSGTFVKHKDAAYSESVTEDVFWHRNNDQVDYGIAPSWTIVDYEGE